MFLVRSTYGSTTSSRSHILRVVRHYSAKNSNNKNQSCTARRWMQSSSTSRSSEASSSSATTATATATPTTATATRLSANASAEERRAYLHQANAEMEKYHRTKELLRQGKLASKRKQGGQQPSNALAIQLTVVGLFIVCFAATPLIGRKIAEDEEFRQKYVPSWYDFTVRKPEKPWTRQELHEQMVAVQTDLRERAIRGEFTADKLQEMQRNLHQYHPPNTSQQDQANVPAGWNKIHPGLADDESVNEE